MVKVRDLFLERSVSGALKYQVPEEANDLGWWKRLVDECADNGVTHLDPFLSVGGSQSSAFDPYKHWGLDYPSELFPEFRSPNCKNSDPKTEYLPELIRYAHQKGLKVSLRIGDIFGTFYPGKEHTLLQVNRHGHYHYFACPDKPEVAKRATQLILEVVERYGSARLGKDSVDRIYFDNFRYGDDVRYGDDGNCCWCSDTLRGFKNKFDQEWKDVTEDKRAEYRSYRIALILKEVNQGIKKVNPEIEIGMTEVAPLLGNMPEFIRPEETGVEFAIIQWFGRRYLAPIQEGYHRAKEWIDNCGDYFNKVGTELECRHISSFSPGTQFMHGYWWDTIPLMYTGLRTACKLKEDLKHSDRFQILTFFNITAVPEKHINRKAMFEAFNCEVPG